MKPTEFRIFIEVTGNSKEETKARFEALQSILYPKAADEFANIEKAETPSPDLVTKSNQISFTLEDVRNALKAFNQKFGRHLTLEILKQFGVERAADLKESDYAKVISLCGAS